MSVESGTACIRAVSHLSYTLWAATISLPDMVVGTKITFVPFTKRLVTKMVRKSKRSNLIPKSGAFGHYRCEYDEALAA